MDYKPLPSPRGITRFAWSFGALFVLWWLGFAVAAGIYLGLLLWMASNGFVPPI